LRHVGSFLLAIFILTLPIFAWAVSVPANPMAQPGIGIIATVTPVPAPAVTAVPGVMQTHKPVVMVTAVPTAMPTAEPTMVPTAEPTMVPTAEPTAEPTVVPTVEPTVEPTVVPTAEPTVVPEVSAAPALPEDEFVEDELLSEEIVALLDAEVMEYLNGGERKIETIDGVRNILLVGVDARPGETRSRSDTMIIVTLDGTRNEIRMTSLMRDMYVAIPGKGNNRLNAAWVYGGPDLLLATIEQNFGLKIDEYVAVDLRVLIEVIDALGGLTLTVETDKQLSAINGVIDAYN